MPLKLHEYTETVFNKGCMEYLSKAANVCITENLDTPHTLSFEYPMIDDKVEKIIENRIVSVDGQAYRLYDVSRIYNGTRILRAKAQRIFFRDAQDHHIPTIGNDTDSSKSTIGVDPYKVIELAIAGTKFELIPDSELAEMGMTRIGADGLKIDFFPTDKMNCYDAINSVIESAGKGELYVDNFRIAVVERIGADNGVRLSLTKNLRSLTVQYASDELVTRLYPYGQDDLTISSVNGGIPYVDSPNIAKYGIIEGCRDYSDYTDPEKVKAHALWDLCDENNYQRLDEARLTISGDIIDLSKLAEYGDMEKIHLGDTVHVTDGKNIYKERIVNISYYPFENKQPTATIGLPNTGSSFFQAWQKSKLFKSTQKNTARGNKLKTAYFTGTVNSTQNPVQSNNKQLLLDGDLLYINDDTGRRRVELGNMNGEFVFNLYDVNGNLVIHFNEKGDGTFSGTIRGAKIESDTDIQVTKDAAVGQYLRVGYISASVNADGTVSYKYQDESGILLGPGASIKADNKGDNIIVNAMGRIELRATSVTKGGYELATAADIDAIKAEINELWQAVNKG